jgi:hypothetical protein
LTTRRCTLIFSIVGGALLVAATTLLVSISWGMTSSTTTDASGMTITTEARTPSIMQDSPRVALGWIVASLLIAVVVALLIRFGGFIGPAVVMCLMWLIVLAGIMTIGIYLAPAAISLCVASLLAIADRADRRQRSQASRPPPHLEHSPRKLGDSGF